MPGPKVLVVDDSWTDLTLIATPLRESGFEVITAVDGDEAVEKVLQERPHLVVLDVILPKQNGFQLCRRLKQMEQSRDIPIILISGKRMAELARHAGLTGAPQASELARLLGQSSGGMSVDDVPEGPRYVVFVVGGVECAMPAACVQGIDRLVDVTPVPHTAAWVLG